MIRYTEHNHRNGPKISIIEASANREVLEVHAWSKTFRQESDDGDRLTFTYEVEIDGHECSIEIVHTRAYPKEDYAGVAGHCEWDTPSVKTAGWDAFNGTFPYASMGQLIAMALSLHDDLVQEVKPEQGK